MEYNFGKKPILFQSKEICQYVPQGAGDKYETHVRINARRRRLGKCFSRLSTYSQRDVCAWIWCLFSCLNDKRLCTTLQYVSLHFPKVITTQIVYLPSSAVKSPGQAEQWRIQLFCSGGEGGPTNSVEDRGQRERGSGGGSPLVSGSGGSCNLVQEISFHIVNFS